MLDEFIILTKSPQKGQMQQMFLTDAAEHSAGVTGVFHSVLVLWPMLLHMGIPIRSSGFAVVSFHFSKNLF